MVLGPEVHGGELAGSVSMKPALQRLEASLDRIDVPARGRLARLAKILEAKIPGHEFQHLATLERGGELVSVFVDLESLSRVAGVIE
jgi:hypothetical protein